MDWYEALKAWQDRKLPAEDAIRIAEVEDIFELWELALGSGIDIKLGDREHIAAVIKGHRQVQRGETVDINDIIFEMDLIIAGITEGDLKRQLRLQWIPTPDGFDFHNFADYERFLALPHKDQLDFLGGLNDDEYQLYQSLLISQASYRPPEDLQNPTMDARPLLGDNDHPNEKETAMGVTVYAYAVEPGTSRITGYGSDMQQVVDELRSVRKEIELEDDRHDLGASEVYAFDMLRPELDQLLAVLSGDAELADMILKHKRLVSTVSE
ncbi:hypothetical protein [Rhizobium leguminosarum]|uniref:hypothetical protein n=1 Tax=Rhizobium leguminosarum TaxID=384 RepID=UPI001C96386F|nr:hypothetical protein [Rhizobium leguminosarum]MBY5329607.1 hypothetical protein [Rhizobium leguminosarum]